MGAYDCDCINNLEYDRCKRKQKEQPQSTTGQLNDGAQSTAQSTDLIDRQEAIDALDCINGVEEVLRSLPPIQPEVLACGNGELVAKPEPKEGHWIRTDCGLDVECKCSACGYKDFVSPHDTYWFKRNFCPNCGAKMTISIK